jgi:nitrogen-specific signal transduction histidine kinase
VQHGGLHLRLEEDKPVPPVLPEGAGGRPFVTVGRRAYGLGLFYAQRVIAAHGGALSAHYDSAARRYVTEITLPMETQAA